MIGSAFSRLNNKFRQTLGVLSDARSRREVQGGEDLRARPVKPLLVILDLEIAFLLALCLSGTGPQKPAHFLFRQPTFHRMAMERPTLPVDREHWQGRPSY